MVWDGNHRLQTWLHISNQNHTHDYTRHYVVEFIIFNVEKILQLFWQPCRKVIGNSLGFFFRFFFVECLFFISYHWLFLFCHDEPKIPCF